MKYATFHMAIAGPEGFFVAVGDRNCYDKSRRRPFKKQARADGRREIERQVEHI